MPHIRMQPLLGCILVALAIGAPQPSLASNLSDDPDNSACETNLETPPATLLGGVPGMPVKIHIVAPPAQLGIGVVVEDMQGRYYLGRAPYTASFHATVVAKLLGTVQVKRIVWMGELRYRLDHQGRVVIHEANETSNYYVTLKGIGLQQDGRDVIIGNGVRDIPPALQAAHFHPIPYDENAKHLVAELSKLPLTSDVRHTIGNALTALGAMVRQMRIGREPRLTQMLDLIQQGQATEHAVLVRHLVFNLIEEGRLTPGAVNVLLAFLTVMQEDSPNPVVVRSFDLAAVATQIQQVNATLATALGQSSVEIYQVPLPSAE